MTRKGQRKTVMEQGYEHAYLEHVELSRLPFLPYLLKFNNKHIRNISIKLDNFFFFFFTLGAVSYRSGSTAAHGLLCFPYS
jgi:hypothetical protein